MGAQLSPVSNGWSHHSDHRMAGFGFVFSPFGLNSCAQKSSGKQGWKRAARAKEMMAERIVGEFQAGQGREGLAGLSLLIPKEHFQELSDPQIVKLWESKDLGCKYFGEVS